MRASWNRTQVCLPLHAVLLSGISVLFIDLKYELPIYRLYGFRQLSCRRRDKSSVQQRL